MSAADPEAERAGHGCNEPRPCPRRTATARRRPELAKDPVCGMSVDPASAKHSAEFAGQTYYFCCAGCREKFLAEPQRYLGEAPAEAAPSAPAGTIYTCPMHPEIRQVGPGSCPICGMALEPETPAAETGTKSGTRRHDAAILGRRGAGGSRGGARNGWPVVEPRRDRQSAGDELDSIGPGDAGGPLGGLAVLRARRAVDRLAQSQHVHPDRAGDGRRLDLQRRRDRRPWRSFPPPFAAWTAPSRSISKRRRRSPRWCCSDRCSNFRARERTGGAIRALLDLAPKTARRVRPDGSDEDVALERVAVGDRLRVRPGDKVAIDGEILEGRSAIDESMVTGESMPVSKTIGDRVVGGTINQSGAFVMRADRVGRDTVLAQIVEMVAKAQRSRAPIQRLADQVVRLVRAAGRRRRRPRLRRVGDVRS